MQLSFEEIDAKTEFKDRIAYFEKRIKDAGLPYDVIAINKVPGNEMSLVIYDRELEGSFTLSIYENEIKYKFSAHDPSGFGYNFAVIDDRFADRQSFLLTNKKRELTSCARRQLEEFSNKGWSVVR